MKGLKIFPWPVADLEELSMPHTCGLPIPAHNAILAHTRRCFVPVLLGMLAAMPAWSAGINLSWNECGSAGADLKTFACNTNAGPSADLYASFVPPAGINQLLGLSAEVRIASTNLPDWWKHGSGECRGTSSLVTDFELPPGACADFWSGRGVVGDKLYTLGAYGPNTARLTVQCAVPFNNAAAVSASNEYYAFRVRILPSQSTGAGSCAGCSTPVNLRLERIQLFQPPAAGNDPILTTAVLRKAVNWQAAVGATPVISNFTPGGGPPATVVTINGSGFTATSSVSFGGVSSAPTSVTDSQVQVPVPAGGRTGPLVLVTPFGTAQSAGNFLVSPRVGEFLPKQGPVGMSVTVKGQNFTSASAVRFNGVPSTFSVVSDSAVLATVPGGATTGPIRIEHAFGFGVSDSVFRVGTASGALNLSWDNCSSAGIALKTFACNTNTGTPFTFYGSFAPPPGVNQLRGLVADLRIFTGGPLPDWWKFGLNQCRGSSALTSSMVFTGETSPCVDPWLGRAFTGTTYNIGYDGPNTARLTITGSMEATTAVDPGIEYQGFKVSIPRTKSTLDGSCAGCATQVSITFERMQLIQPAGAGFDPQFGLPIHRNQIAWQAQPGPPPVITSFSPTSGPISTPVTISGNNFTGALSVQFGSTAATFTVPSATEIQTSVPVGARTSLITVTTPQGQSSSVDSFVVPRPVVNSFSPAAGAPGQPVTVLGSNFNGASAVRFGGVPGGFSVVNNGRINATVPVGGRTGPIEVEAAGSGASAASFIVAPTITTFGPRQAPEGYAITIRGFNFANASVVRFNGLSATFTINSDSVVIANVPAGATSGPITVQNPGGTGTSPVNFIVGPLLPGTINLSWNDCGVAGIQTLSSSCVNSGAPYELIASFEPPAGITELRGVAGDLRIATGGDLPDWWKHGVGQCRGSTNLSTNFDFTTGATACADVWTGQATGNYTYDIGFGGTNMARMVVTGSLPSGVVRPADPSTQYYAFRVRIQRAQSSGSGSCAGCLTAASITLNEVQLFQTAALNYDPVLTTPRDRNVAYWQAVPGPAAVITSFTPTAGGPGQGVTIYGARFSGTSSVLFNTVPASFTVVDDGTITTTVPPGARTGPLRVTGPNGTVSSTDIFIVAPEITNFSPSQAPTGTLITISGFNFTQTQTVEFNGTAASFVEVNDNQLRATVPASATSGPIRVTNAGGIDLSDRYFVVGPLGAGGFINLSWNDCGEYGPGNITFACNTNTGAPFTMIGSFIPPPNINQFLGISTTINITSSMPTSLPEWWKHGSAYCRGTVGLSTNFDFTTGPFNCIDFYVGQAAGGSAYDVGFGSPDRARLRIQCAVPFDNRGPVDAGSEYYAFKANILRSRTTGTGSCAGCNVPMCIVLDEIQLFQPPEEANDPILFSPQNRNFVTWQNIPPGCPFPTATLGSLVSSDASDGVVRVVWRTESIDPVTVYRRDGEAAAWQSVSSIVPDGSHRVRFEDRDVVAGRTYHYRIGVTVPAGEVYLGETQVQVPVAGAPASLELSAVNVNGSGLALSITLPRASNATFEVYDLSGRRQLSRSLEGLKAGTHRIEVPGASALRSGVYFARLLQDSHKAQRRFVIVR